MSEPNELGRAGLGFDAPGRVGPTAAGVHPPPTGCAAMGRRRTEAAISNRQPGGWRILFVLPRTSPTPVGALKVVYIYADGLAARGHRVTLVHLGVPGLHQPRPWYSGRRDVRSLVVEHLSEAVIGPPYDLTIATTWQVVPQVAGLSSVVGRKLIFLQDFESYELGSDAERAVIRESLRIGWPMIAASRPVQELVMAIAGHACPVVTCGVDLSLFNLRTPVTDPCRRLIGFPARNERVKRTADAIAAVEILHADRGEFHGVWCFGAFDHRLPTWVTHYPQPSDGELRDLYNRTAVFVVPSEFEGFGLAGAEAMACGAALVSTRNRGVESYAIDRHSALLCEPGEPPQLAELVERLLDDDRQRWRIAQAGVQAMATHSWSDAMADFVTRLQDLLQEPAG